MAKSYRLKRDAFIGHFARATAKTAILFAIVILAILWKSDLPKDRLTTFLMIIFGALAVVVWRSFIQQQDAWDKYRLIISEDAISCRIQNHPDLVIERSAITRVTKSRRGSLSIHGSGTSPAMGIPSAIENREEVVAELATIRPIELLKPVVPGWLVMFVTLGVILAALGGTFLTNNPAIVVPSGIFAGTASVICAVMTLRSPHLDPQTRRTSLILVFPILAAYGRAVMFWLEWKSR